MSRKRKLDTTLPDEDVVQEDAPAAGGLGGFWGSSATNMLQTRLRDVQQSFSDGILHGVTAISIPVDRIVDQVGSDRLGNWVADESFAALKADIKRRGQRQPIRVRPLDPEWLPDAEPPYAGQGQFVLQSGRRRLRAAQDLGLEVLAVISTDIGDKKLADLEERFLENTMRADLNAFEQLLSIGLIAQSHGDQSQSDIATRLGVPQGDVSLGLSCVELHDRIVEAVDIQTTPKRKYREIIPKLRGNDSKRGRGARPPKGTSERVLSRKAGAMTVETRSTPDGLVLKVSGKAFGFTELDRLSKILTEAIARETDS